jgi:hypothetical protein
MTNLREQIEQALTKGGQGSGVRGHTTPKKTVSWSLAPDQDGYRSYVSADESDLPARTPADWREKNGVHDTFMWHPNGNSTRGFVRQVGNEWRANVISGTNRSVSYHSSSDDAKAHVERHLTLMGGSRKK